MRNSSTRMAVECALYELAARANDQPLWKYLGGHVGRVATDMTFSAVMNHSDIESLVRTAKEHVDEGFRTLKIKVGAGGDDVTTLLEIRRLLGDTVILRVDANQGWSRQEAFGSSRSSRTWE